MRELLHGTSHAGIASWDLTWDLSSHAEDGTSDVGIDSWDSWDIVSWESLRNCFMGPHMRSEFACWKMGPQMRELLHGISHEGIAS